MTAVLCKSCKHVFYQPVFYAVEGYNRHTPALRKQYPHSSEPRLKRAELVIYSDAQCLKSFCRRMYAPVAIYGRYGVLHHLNQLQSGLKWFFGAALYYGSCNPTRKALLAVAKKDIGQHLFAPGVENLRCGKARAWGGAIYHQKRLIV